MKLKRFSLLTLLSGALLSMIAIIVSLIKWQNDTSQNGAIGIIGGVDTPTYELVVLRLMNGWSFCAIVLGITLIISALFCLIFANTVKNNCHIKTTAISLGLSGVGALGLVCVFVWFTIVSFGEMSKHPVEYPLSLLLGSCCLCAFILLTVLYFKVRKMNWSLKGVIMDTLTGIVYLPTFFFIFAYLYEMIA